MLTLYTVLSCYPFLWMISAALKSNQEVLSSQSLIPREVRLDVLVDTWNKLQCWTFLVNSFVVTAITVLGIVMVYSVAGYGFAKTKCWGATSSFSDLLGCC